MSEEKICKNCGKQISEDFKLCPYCGEKVEEKILEIPCRFCGKTIKSDFKVCPYCGNNLNSKKENYLEETNLNTNQSDNPLICQFCGKLKKSEFQICPYCGNNPNYKKENYNNYNNHNNDYNNHNTENRANYNSNNYEVSSKSGIICLLLSIFLPPFHRFYAGKIDSAISLLIFYIYFYFSLISGIDGKFSTVLFVFVSIILPICWIIDLVSILRGKFKDSKGRYIKLSN